MAAVLRGDWAELEEQTRHGLSLAAWAEAKDERPSEEDLDAAGQEFRYERELVAAEEMEAWLERWGLTVEGWMECMERALLRQSRNEVSWDDLETFAPDRDTVLECLAAEAVCSGALGQFAERLASRAAIFDRAAAETGAPPLSEPSIEDRKRGDRSCLEICRWMGVPEQRRGERTAELLRLENRFDAYCQEIGGEKAIRRQIDAHRVDWVRVDARALLFDDAASAREALLCVREDGQSFEDIAEDAHRTLEEARLYLSDVEEGARADFLSGAPGEVIGPIAVGERFGLFQLFGKTAPSEEDPELRRRAEETVLAKAVEGEVASRVRWHERI